MEVIIYPLIALLVGIVLSLITGTLKKGDVARIISILSLITAISLLAVFYPFNGQRLYSDTIVLDNFGGFFVFLFLSLAVFILLGSTKMLDDHPEMPALLLLSTIGMALIGITDNLVMIFVAWELMSLTTYVLAGLGKREQSTEAAMKYYIYGSVSSALILFSISLIYGITGSMQLSTIATIASSLDTTAIGVLLLSATIFIFGFGYKVGMVPFHLWLPDVYEGSPAPVSGLLAGVSKKVAIVATARIFLTGFGDVDFNWKILYAIIAVITMTVANIAALSQRKVVRMFAYSSISQIGYMIVGFAIFSPEGLAATMMQLTVHAVTTVGAFITIGIIAKKLNLKTYDDYKGLGARKPVLGLGLTIMMLSLAGIPPLAGFVSKLFLFTEAVRANLLWLAIVLVLNSVLSLGYYLPLIRNMYLEKPEKTTEGEEMKKEKFDTRTIGPIMVNIMTTLAIIIIPIFAQKIFDIITEAAKNVI
ncbi:MAG: NADH-quinone oxidoreductase subunit N [Candidatus Heimdallarchaeaceae archaeon]